MSGGAPWWLTTVGWFVTVVGWLVTSYQANRREARKEKRAEVDACCKLAAELLDKARVFYSLPGAHESASGKAAEVRFLLQRLLSRLERMQLQDARFRLRLPGSDLMESLTGGDFESIGRLALGVSDPVLLDIEGDTHRVMNELEIGFQDSFLLPLHQRILNRFTRPDTWPTHRTR